MKYDPGQGYFLVSQEDLYKIDCLIGCLNLAITEILERRPVRDHSRDPTPAQEEYDAQVANLIDTPPFPDPRQSQFDF
jgi:hypothetical protein